MYPAPPAIRIFIYCLLVPFLDTTKVPVSITYAYGTILAVREEQSPALKRDTSLRHGACYNLFLYRSRLLSWADATFQPPLGDVKSCSVKNHRFESPLGLSGIAPRSYSSF